MTPRAPCASLIGTHMMLWMCCMTMLSLMLFCVVGSATRMRVPALVALRDDAAAEGVPGVVGQVLLVAGDQGHQDAVDLLGADQVAPVGVGDLHHVVHDGFQQPVEVVLGVDAVDDAADGGQLPLQALLLGGVLAAGQLQKEGGGGVGVGGLAYLGAEARLPVCGHVQARTLLRDAGVQDEAELGAADGDAVVVEEDGLVDAAVVDPGAVLAVQVLNGVEAALEGDAAVGSGRPCSA